MRDGVRETVFLKKSAVSGGEAFAGVGGVKAMDFIVVWKSAAESNAFGGQSQVELLGEESCLSSMVVLSADSKERFVKREVGVWKNGRVVIWDAFLSKMLFLRERNIWRNVISGMMTLAWLFGLAISFIILV